MFKHKADSEKCVFCRYWEGRKAEKSSQPKYWEYEQESNSCLKKLSRKVHSSENGCREFELDTYTYFD